MFVSEKMRRAMALGPSDIQYFDVDFEPVPASAAIETLSTHARSGGGGRLRSGTLGLHVPASPRVVAELCGDPRRCRLSSGRRAGPRILLRSVFQGRVLHRRICVARSCGPAARECVFWTPPISTTEEAVFARFAALRRLATGIPCETLIPRNWFGRFRESRQTANRQSRVPGADICPDASREWGGVGRTAAAPGGFRENFVAEPEGFEPSIRLYIV